MKRRLSWTRQLRSAVFPLGLAVLASATHAQTTMATPRENSIPDIGKLEFVGADYKLGFGVFVDVDTVDRSVPNHVGISTLYVVRNQDSPALLRYETAAQTVDCTDDNHKFLRQLSSNKFLANGTVAEQKTKPGYIREAVPGSMDARLWQLACRDSAFPDQSGEHSITGLAQAMAYYDPLQEEQDDILNNNGVPANPDDPGRALYLDIRHKDLAATSQDEVLPLLADYERAADQGSRQAMWRLAELSERLKIPGGGDMWGRRLADAGDARAQYLMAGQLKAAQPCDLSRSYLQRSAEQGYTKAELTLGTFYQAGTCGPVDLTQAATWYEKAARDGDFNAQLHLGYLYERGLGVKASAGEAAAWYSIATGHSDWEDGIDQYKAELALDHIRTTSFLSHGTGDYRDRARQLCQQDRVCSLVAIKDVGDVPKMAGLHKNFHEETLADDRYRVQYRGNGLLGKDVIIAVAIMRGAEHCRSAGYPYLTAKTEDMQTLAISFTDGSGNSLYKGEWPTASVEVYCSYVREPNSVIAVDFIKSAGEAYASRTYPNAKP